MNEKITLPQMAQLLALRSGDSQANAEEFLKEFFSCIATTLIEGDHIKIKDLGVFKAVTVEARKSVNVQTGEEVEIPAHRKVVFSPDKELAAIINEPFEMFETVELSDDMAESMTSFPNDSDDTESGDEEGYEIEITNELHNELPDELPDEQFAEQPVEYPDEYPDEHPDETITQPVEHPLEEPSEEPTVETEEEPIAETKVEHEEYKVDKEVEQEVPTADELVDEPVIETAKESHKRTGIYFWLGLLCGAVAVLLIEVISLFALGYIDFDKFNISKNNTDKIETSQTAKSQPAASQKTTVQEPTKPTDDSKATADKSESPRVAEAEEAAPTQPSDKKVYDTITKTRYLTTMAKDQYGNYNLWPYIYEENKAFLGHPDRIKPGTQVVVPDLKKYGVNPKNPDDIEKAKKKGIEIYSRY